MGIGREIQFRGGSFAGIPLGNQVLGQTTLQFAKPLARRALQVLLKNALQVPLGDGA